MGGRYHGDEHGTDDTKLPHSFFLSTCRGSGKVEEADENALEQPSYLLTTSLYPGACLSDTGFRNGPQYLEGQAQRGRRESGLSPTVHVTLEEGAAGPLFLFPGAHEG